MAVGKPLFCGISEVDQLFQIFSRLGLPSPKYSLAMSGFCDLSIFPQFNNRLSYISELRNVNSHHFDLELLKRCFAFEPFDRATAKEGMVRVQVLRGLDACKSILKESCII